MGGNPIVYERGERRYGILTVTAGEVTVVLTAPDDKVFAKGCSKPYSCRVESTPEPTAETCVACARLIDSPYCPHCGERRASDRRHTLREFAREHVLEALANFDGRVIRTTKLLLLRPGQLTVEFMRGVRLRYMPPLQAFLLVNLVFFVWSAAAHFKVLDTSYRQHMQLSYRDGAHEVVMRRLGRTHEDSTAFIQRFDAVGETQARSLVIVMIPAFALFAWLLTVEKKEYAVQHLVFSLHLYAFALIWLAIAMYIAIGVVRLIWLPLGFHFDARDNDNVLLTSIASGITAYLAISFRRAYGLSKPRAIATALVAAVLMLAIFNQYRRLLFFVTFWSS